MARRPLPTDPGLRIVLAMAGAILPAAGPAAEVDVSGELKQWHRVTLTLDGPSARETDEDPNPFTDYRFEVEFRHESGDPVYQVPGYFAADGRAAHTSAAGGTKWRAHLSPDRPGLWTYRVSFSRGKHAAVSGDGEPLEPFDGLSGGFSVEKTDKTGRDFRAHGRLQYAGARYLRFAGTGEWFLKAGPDSPENLLACADFDGTMPMKSAGAPRAGEAAPAGLKTWQPHVRDWREGDPTWRDGRGKGLIGALNYLAAKGLNAFSFLPYNVGGDGQDVWPFIAPGDKLHYDCSKLDQWAMVFDHATRLGLFLHWKLQEQENDDNRPGGDRDRRADVAASLDGGDLGVERKLYCRELIARFGSALALNWNLGEENTQSPDQQRAMALYLRDTDPYRHPIVVHTFPDWQDRVYTELLGEKSVLTGASLQNHWDAAHQRALHWVRASAAAGRPWVVCHDEQGDASLGVPPDPGYAGSDGLARERSGRTYNLHDIRKRTLWGTLLAGGGGVEYYFGYSLPQNDLVCEDWRSRDRSWDFCRIALEFMRGHVPFWQMASANALAGNAANDNSRYCLAAPGEVYLVYLPGGGAAEVDLAEHSGGFDVRWFDPRRGGALQRASVVEVKGPGRVALGQPPSEPDQDWAVLVKRRPSLGFSAPLSRSPGTNGLPQTKRFIEEARVCQHHDRGRDFRRHQGRRGVRTGGVLDIRRGSGGPEDAEGGEKIPSAAKWGRKIQARTAMAFPGRDWEERPPASQGVSPERLSSALDWFKSHSGRDGARELVIVRNGYLVWRGEGIDRRHGIWSCTKSFTSTVLGLLISDGRCALDSRAAGFAPELAAHYPGVTLRHFTTMTSGYRAVGDEPKGGYRHGPSSTPFQPSPQPLFAPPGSQYAYWDSAMNLLGLVLTRIAGEPIEELFRRRIAGPIGMTGWDWGDHSLDAGVVVNGGSGNGEKHVFISARELARLGHLFLNQGHWDGRQLLSADWIREATAAQVPATLPWAQPESEIDGRGCYGFNWWANGVKPDGARLWPGAPPGTFAAAGHNNNRLFVIPEWRMVIARLGLDQADRKIQEADWSEFLRLMGEALERDEG